METGRIALSCFIGGVLGCITYLLLSRSLWSPVVALVVAFIVAYLSLQFRDVQQAVSSAVQEIAEDESGEGKKALAAIQAAVQSWFTTQHPYRQTSTVCALIITGLLVKLWLVWQHHFIPTHWLVVDFVVSWFVVGVVLVVSTMIGMAGYSLMRTGLNIDDSDIMYKQLSNKYLDTWPHSYAGMARWVLMGLVTPVIVPLYAVLLVFPVWLWKVGSRTFVKIHSHKRLLCGTDAALGFSVATALIYHASQLTIGDKVVYSLLGGLLGAMFGVASWELISKRILRVTS